jgi:UPF0716 protein FxsA
MVLIALIAVPVVEVLAFVAVGLAIGWAWAVALLLGTSLVGVLMVRAESRAGLARVSLAASEGRVPVPAAVEAALGLLGAVLLLLPGFVSGAVGLVLLIPPTRRAVRRTLSRHFARRVMRFGAVAQRFGSRGPGMRPADVDATAVEDDPRELDR